MDYKKLKKLIIFGSFFFLLFFVWLLFGLFPKKAEPPVSVTPTQVPVSRAPTPEISGNKIKISEIWVDNFYETGRKSDDGNDVVIKENNDFKIIYQNPFKLFIVNVLSSPFEKVREEAEEEFIKSLGITESEACKLNVKVGTPFFANPEYAKRSYKLSFCE